MRALPGTASHFFVLSHDRGELSLCLFSGKQLSALFLLLADPAPQFGEVPVSGAQPKRRREESATG